MRFEISEYEWTSSFTFILRGLLRDRPYIYLHLPRWEHDLLQEPFILGVLVNKNFLSAISRTHVDFVIFSFIIRSSADVKTVFSICACNPLKKPDIPSLSQMECIVSDNVLRCCDLVLPSPFSSGFAAWIITLHLFIFQILAIWRYKTSEHCKQQNMTLYYGRSLASSPTRCEFWIEEFKIVGLVIWRGDNSHLIAG